MKHYVTKFIKNVLRNNKLSTETENNKISNNILEHLCHVDTILKQMENVYVFILSSVQPCIEFNF